MTECPKCHPCWHLAMPPSSVKLPSQRKQLCFSSPTASPLPVCPKCDPRQSHRAAGCGGECWEGLCLLGAAALGMAGEQESPKITP